MHSDHDGGTATSVLVGGEQGICRGLGWADTYVIAAHCSRTRRNNKVRSAIYIPRKRDAVPDATLEELAVKLAMPGADPWGTLDAV